MKTLITLLAASSLLVAGAAQAQNRSPSGNPLSSIFSCQTANNKQGQGAAIGAIVGGIAGNKLSDDKGNNTTRNTILGAAIGAAAGSYIGCKMGTDDSRRAQTATQTALQQGKDQTWQGANGTSGKIHVVETYNYGYEQNGKPGQFNLSQVRWANGVEQPRNYSPASGAYRATGNVVLRGRPSNGSPQVGTLRNGDLVDGYVRPATAGWLLVGQNGVALGYVTEASLQEAPVKGGKNSNNGNGKPRYDPKGGPMCRTFDQTYTPGGGQAETQRYVACQTASGDWVVQGNA